MTNSIILQKQAIRTKITKLRNSLPLQEKEILDKQIIANLEKKLTTLKIAIFYPKENEINLLPLQKKHQLLIPKINLQNILEFYPLDKNNLALNPKLKIFEPKTTSTPIIPNTIICPLLAYDKNNNRLGYGGGYYDRTIEKLKKLNKNITLIGVAYSFQEIENLPTEPHDSPLDFIITNNTSLLS